MREPAWTSANPFLCDNYAPVHDEIDADGLEIVGNLPECLRGAYVRNGPNPAFAPISYTYPFDGDGMLHAVYLDGGRARYRNRYVATRGLAAERRAARAVYGGIASPFPVAPSLTAPDGDPGPFKDGAFIHVIGHAGKRLAMWEGGPAYEVTDLLETVDEWRAGTDAPLDVGPHTRLDPVTGELFLINYAMRPPFLEVLRVDAQGRLSRRIPVELPAPTMMHDFVLTRRYVVLFHFPAVFDPAGPEYGEPLLVWRPELGARIGLLDRRDPRGGVRWIQTAPFFAFHFANGYERGNEIVVDYVRHEALVSGDGPEGHTALSSRLHRIVVRPEIGTVETRPLSAVSTEFPRIRDEWTSRASRFVYAPVCTGSPPAKGCARVFRGLARFDCENGTEEICDLDGGEIGEVVFIPRGAEEDDGWLTGFVYVPERDAGEFWVFDARNVGAGPVARVLIPRRVPHGLHGNWFPAKE